MAVLKKGIQVAWDIDGCFVDSWPIWKEEIIKEIGNVPIDFNPWILEAKVFEDTLVKAYCDRWEDIPPCEGAVEVITELYNRTGEEIRFITLRRGINIVNATYAMIAKLLPDIKFHIHFVSEYEHKLNLMGNYPMIIEDNPKIVEYLLDNKKVVIMPIKKYNTCVQHRIGLIRIPSIAFLKYHIKRLIR